MTDMADSSSKVERIANSSTFAMLGRGAAMASAGMMGWMLLVMVSYGNALTRLEVITANLTSEIAKLNGQIAAESSTRYTKEDASRDFGYRDQQIKALQDHMIGLDPYLKTLDSRVTRIEPRR